MEINLKFMLLYSHGNIHANLIALQFLTITNRDTQSVDLGGRRIIKNYQFLLQEVVSPAYIDQNLNAMIMN